MGLEFRRKSQDRDMSWGVIAPRWWREFWAKRVLPMYFAQKKQKRKSNSQPWETPAFEGWAKEEDQGEKMRRWGQKRQEIAMKWVMQL